MVQKLMVHHRSHHGAPPPPRCTTSSRCTSTPTLVPHYTGLSGSLGTRPMVCRQYIAAFALAFFLSLVATDPM